MHLLICLILGLASLPSLADANNRNAVSSDMAYVQLVELPVAQVKNYYTELAKKRTLNPQELKSQNLLTIAGILEVEKIMGTNKDPAFLNDDQIQRSITKKIQQNPHWDKAPSALVMSQLKTHAPLIKSSFPEKSYAAAWFKKQLGETQTAKQILEGLFNSGYETGMKLENRDTGEGDLVNDLTMMKSALDSMSTVDKKKDLESKLQKVKTRYSNLPSAMMMT